MVADLAVLVFQKMFTIEPSVEWLQLFKFAFVICIINKIGKAFGGHNYSRIATYVATHAYPQVS